MSITGDAGQTLEFGHVGFQVSDLERSVSFYVEVIGLELVDRLLREDAYLSAVTGYDGVRLDIALLVERRSSVMLELVSYLSHAGMPVDASTANPGTAHVCFVVDDVDAIYRRALAAGHGAVNPPVTPTAGMWAGGRSVYLRDPDDIRVELVQRGSVRSG